MSVIHPQELEYEDGAFLVKIARRAIELYLTMQRILEPPSDTPEKLMKNGMAFVTIEKLIGERKELRGCIGFLEPRNPLIETVIKAAISAATEDPRFEPMTIDELENSVIEVSVLSPYTEIKDPLNEVEIGRHGIYIVHGILNRGVLLPQVPIDYCWDVETYLAEGCLKAGLAPDAWMSKRTKIYVFEAMIFMEVKPKGEVIIRDLRKEYEEKCGLGPKT